MVNCPSSASLHHRLQKCCLPLTSAGFDRLRGYASSSAGEEGPYRMPVVPLKQSCERLLESVKPLLADAQYDSATKLVNKFIEPDGIGEKLQKLLENRAEDKESWLSEWWQNYGYLDYRASVPINVSPGIIMKEQVFRDTSDQIEFAARFVAGVLHYKRTVDGGALPQEKMLGASICMAQHYKIFASCRRPLPRRDAVVQRSSKDCRHIVVVHNNHSYLERRAALLRAITLTNNYSRDQFFEVPFSNVDGDPLNLAQLRDHLMEVVERSRDTVAPPVGLLTATDRDAWARANGNLLRHDKNKQIVDSIERSAFVLCFDRPSSPLLEPRPLTSKREPTDRYTTLGRQMNYGGGSQLNSANRWCDKTLQIIVGSDGAFGASYEHTAAEGPPVISVIDSAYEYTMQCRSDYPAAKDIESIKKLEFIIDSDIEQDMNEAAKLVDKQISRFELHAFTFREFGKEAIKRFKMSPDAFIQVALQLAYFRLHGAPCATYESGSLRRFVHGRTDVIRSCSMATLSYSMAMTDPDLKDSVRAEALRAAVNSHSQYSRDVVLGNGIDRHLLGLKLTAEEHNIPTPDLFKHAVWTESTSWKLSTSQVASTSDSLLTFGAVVTDGYGFCYNPCGDHINYMVSSWRQSTHTAGPAFSAAVRRALCDGHDLLAGEQQRAST